MIEPTNGTEPAIHLASRVTGPMRLYQASRWTFQEDVQLAETFNIMPGTDPDLCSSKLSTAHRAILTDIFIKEMEMDFVNEADLDSYCESMDESDS